MKKYLNVSLIYAVAAMIGGVFYREFTKLNSFDGITVLGKVHTHLFLLGMITFLIVALFAGKLALKEQKVFCVFMIVYNIGVSLTAVMMVIRGIVQVLGVSVSSGKSASISGITGIGHIMKGSGIILLITSLKKAEEA